MKLNLSTAKILRLFGIIFVAFFLLSGCARYDVGIRFVDANHGEITQHIRLDENIPGLGGTVINSWLEDLEQQATQLGGRVQHLSSQESLIRVPFYNAKDLQNKFNQLFYAQVRSTRNHSPLNSQLQITTGNWIAWQRHHLQYDLDLRGLELPALSDASNHASTSKPPLELEFSLKTPWGAKTIDKKYAKADDAGTGYASNFRQQRQQIIWQLQPGKINHMEAVFWVPSPLGIGLVLIVLLVVGGSYIKTRRNQLNNE